MMNSYWWGVKGCGIRWMSWKMLARRKEEGSLGFRDLHAFKLAMLGRQGWKLISQPDAMVSQFSKAKYFPHRDFLDYDLK